MDNTSYGRQILFVEDDRTVRQEVRQFLEHNGYTVIAAERGQQAIEIITRVLPDLALIDYYLPDMLGFDVCKAIKRYAEVPIILLTREDEEEIIVQALEQYAEDYITKPRDKPIPMPVLEARISRVLKRFNGPADESYAEMIVDDHLHVNFSRHWVDVRQPGEEEYKRVPLTPIESRIMHILIRNAGRVMTTEALLARVWAGDDEAYPEGLRVHIRRLRVKIEPQPETPKYIITERGLGYRFAVPVKQGLTNATD